MLNIVGNLTSKLMITHVLPYGLWRVLTPGASDLFAVLFVHTHERVNGIHTPCMPAICRNVTFRWCLLERELLTGNGNIDLGLADCGCFLHSAKLVSLQASEAGHPWNWFRPWRNQKFVRVILFMQEHGSVCCCIIWSSSRFGSSVRAKQSKTGSPLYMDHFCWIKKWKNAKLERLVTREIYIYIII